MSDSNKNKDLKDEIIKDNTVKTEDINQSKPKKERSNAVKMLTLLGAAVVACMIFLIATGAWNPFKSQDIAKDAQEIVDNSEEYYNGVLEGAGIDMSDSIMQSYYGKDADYPYGGITTDYGKNGDMSGTLKSFRTVSTLYDEMYGGRFIQYVMKNEEHAKERYKGMVNGKSNEKFTVKEEKHFDNVDVYTFYNGDKTNFYIRQGSVVYDFWGLSIDGRLNLTQKFFDYLKIDYQVPQAK